MTTIRAGDLRVGDRIVPPPWDPDTYEVTEIEWCPRSHLLRVRYPDADGLYRGSMWAVDAEVAVEAPPPEPG